MGWLEAYPTGIQQSIRVSLHIKELKAAGICIGTCEQEDTQHKIIASLAVT
jgi:hypothetical protein